MPKQPWQILHLSDFHLADPSGPSELLRRGHFSEYIRDLFHALRTQRCHPLDCVMLTGDFVDRGVVDNYGDVKSIVTSVIKESGLDNNSVIVCPGNHDIVRSFEECGNSVKAREAYVSFSHTLGNKTAIESDAHGRSGLFKIRDDIWVLSIDATLGSTGPDFGPGTWKDAEREDDPITWVQNHLKNPDELLIVLSHYPVEELQGSLAPDEEPNFHARHIWTKGRQLAVRIGRWRSKIPAKTLWLSGDIHLPHRASANGIEYVTAGRFGCRPDRNTTQLRQAKVIQVSGEAARTKVVTFNYEMPGHRDRPAGGTWIAREDQIPTDKLTKASRAIIDKAHPLRIEPRETAGVSPPPKANIETVESEVEKRFIETIASKKLYSLGRFETHDDEVALGWVNIGSLLNSGNLLAAALRGMNSWLGQKLDVQTNPGVFSDTLLIGIDCWGAVLASQLSVLCGAKNYCVAYRGGGLPYTLHERISAKVISRVRMSRNIVLIQDAVGSGRSLHGVFDEICEKISKDEIAKINWFAMSLICDRDRDRGETCSFLSAHGTVCGALRMPSIRKSRLPEYEVCPPLLAFHSASEP